jgi:hypothetical protein
MPDGRSTQRRFESFPSLCRTIPTRHATHPLVDVVPPLHDDTANTHHPKDAVTGVHTNAIPRVALRRNQDDRNTIATRRLADRSDQPGNGVDSQSWPLTARRLSTASWISLDGFVSYPAPTLIFTGCLSRGRPICGSVSGASSVQW